MITLGVWTHECLEPFQKEVGMQSGSLHGEVVGLVGLTVVGSGISFGGILSA